MPHWKGASGGTGNTIKLEDTQLQLEIIHPFWFFGGYPIVIYLPIERKISVFNRKILSCSLRRCREVRNRIIVIENENPEVAACL